MLIGSNGNEQKLHWNLIRGEGRVIELKEIQHRKVYICGKKILSWKGKGIKSCWTPIFLTKSPLLGAHPFISPILIPPPLSQISNVGTQDFYVFQKLAVFFLPNNNWPEFLMDQTWRVYTLLSCS